jgi:hypothetical protein
MLGALGASALAAAATIDELDVSKHRGRYALEAFARLEATPESIYAVLTDFDDNAYSRISRVYKESRYLEPTPDGTLMTYRVEMEPDFFVPPVIGPWYLKRTLSQGGQRAVTRIERLARELDGRPNPPLPPLPSRARPR